MHITVPAGRLVYELQFVNRAETEKLVASPGPDGQAAAVLVEVDEVDVRAWVPHRPSYTRHDSFSRVYSYVWSL